MELYLIEERVRIGAWTGQGNNNIMTVSHEMGVARGIGHQHAHQRQNIELWSKVRNR